MWDTPGQSKRKSESNSELSFTYFPDHHYHLTPVPGVRVSSSTLFVESII